MWNQCNLPWLYQALSALHYLFFLKSKTVQFCVPTFLLLAVMTIFLPHCILGERWYASLFSVMTLTLNSDRSNVMKASCFANLFTLSEIQLVNNHFLSADSTVHQFNAASVPFYLCLVVVHLLLIQSLWLIAGEIRNGIWSYEKII